MKLYERIAERVSVYDDWKEDFLKQIEGEHRITVEFPNRDFRLVGLPLYNEQVRKQVFEKAFRSVFGKI